MAVEFGLGYRHAGWHQHDLQRGCAGDDVVGGAEGDDWSWDWQNIVSSLV
jgi:hypothetical protein